MILVYTSHLCSSLNSSASQWISQRCLVVAWSVSKHICSSQLALRFCRINIKLYINISFYRPALPQSISAPAPQLWTLAPPLAGQAPQVGNQYSRAVVFNPVPEDPLLCTFYMSPLLNTPDSDHQFIRIKIYERHCVCQIRETYKCAEQWVPRNRIENHCSRPWEKVTLSYTFIHLIYRLSQYKKIN